MNTLFYGDNLPLLARHVPDASVDLVYLDPPFNSNRDYNVLFREQSGHESPAQMKAFGDTWNWAGALEAWTDFAELCPVPKVIELMHGFRNAIGENDVMAYLVMMAPRLYHLHRVLKPTGSLYLHCDPTASAYLRLILDCLFGARNFKNEIIWKRTSGHSDANRFGAVHDVILFYAKSKEWTWNRQYMERDEAALKTHDLMRDPETGRLYRLDNLSGAGAGPARMFGDVYIKPPAGRHWVYTQDNMNKMFAEGRIAFTRNGTPRYKRYLDELPGFAVQDTWTDIGPINAGAKGERLGYPTQKPVALLERIIQASSNPGDTVLDPFCGCGTAVVAAQKLNRQWIGMDITPLAVSLVQKRLYDAFQVRDAHLQDAATAAVPPYEIIGLPTDEAGAIDLFRRDHKAFEMWAVGLVPAIPQEKKGADRGIDGLAYFNDNLKAPTKAVVQVKGGGVGVGQIRDLIGTMQSENAKMGFFVCLEKPTTPMYDAARTLGLYQPPQGVGKRVPALQIRTVGELLSGQPFDFPVYGGNVTFARAAALAPVPGQGALDV